MSHQPYETWILDIHELSEDQRRSLEQHVEGCADCRNLRERWTHVQGELSSPVVTAPRMGFTNRWQAGFNQRRLREQRRQAWKLFLACSSAAALVFVSLVVYLVFSTTPVEWVQAGVRIVSSSVGMVTTLRDVSFTWSHMVPPVLSVAFWISLFLTFLMLTCVWVFALWRTSLGGMIQK
jgi:hypothetical protein